jgi:hypothetical protein
MDASLRPDDTSTEPQDTLPNRSDTEDTLKKAFAAARMAKTGSNATYDPLADFDRETATDAELADRFRNLSEQTAALYLIKPDCEAWTDDEWTFTTAKNCLKHEIDIREGIVRDRKRGFRICPKVLRAEWNATWDWAAGMGVGGNMAHMKRDLDGPETNEERRIREANPELPIVANMQEDMLKLFYQPAFEREKRMYKATDEEAHAKALEALIAAPLTKSEQDMLMGPATQMYEVKVKKEANRDKVRRHREKNKLGAEHFYVGDGCWPEGWTEEDILQHLSPPADPNAPPKSAKERDRDRKRAARAEAKKPVEGSNEEPKPQLAPLPYRQKLASIKASLTGLGYQDLENIETFLTIMTRGWKSSAWEGIEQTLAGWRDGIHADESAASEEGGPAVAE